MEAQPDVGSAEADAQAEAIDAGAGDLADVVRARLPEAVVPLQDVRLVEQVEHVHAQGEAEVAEGELLLDAGIDHVDVVEAELVRLAGDLHVVLREVLARQLLRAAPEVGQRVALAAVEVGRDVEAPRTVRGDLVEAVDAVRPLAVDVDAALAARAGARALHDDVTFAGATGERLGRVLDLA